MKKFAILLTSIATLGLSACVAPIDDLGEVVVPLPIPVPVPVSTPDVVKKATVSTSAKSKPLPILIKAKTKIVAKLVWTLKNNVPPITMKCFVVMNISNAQNITKQKSSSSDGLLAFPQIRIFGYNTQNPNLL